ncbi:hypothetical protein DPMN_085280 [Dreissena polymorpha]|uniref:Uncharacterized protein n=1 Tax=Dreissena polymorpha TaxID=45954 RepID=A0A9D3YFV9_DREPO|nr:hypothetical protein DPMN_085280 [Dreissena polymorpha]
MSPSTLSDVRMYSVAEFPWIVNPGNLPKYSTTARLHRKSSSPSHVTRFLNVLSAFKDV